MDVPHSPLVSSVHDDLSRRHSYGVDDNDTQSNSHQHRQHRHRSHEEDELDHDHQEEHRRRRMITDTIDHHHAHPHHDGIDVDHLRFVRDDSVHATDLDHHHSHSHSHHEPEPSGHAMIGIEEQGLRHQLTHEQMEEHHEHGQFDHSMHTDVAVSLLTLSPSLTPASHKHMPSESKQMEVDGFSLEPQHGDNPTLLPEQQVESVEPMPMQEVSRLPAPLPLSNTLPLDMNTTANLAALLPFMPLSMPPPLPTPDLAALGAQLLAAQLMMPFGMPFLPPMSGGGIGMPFGMPSLGTTGTNMPFLNPASVSPTVGPNSSPLSPAAGSSTTPSGGPIKPASLTSPNGSLSLGGSTNASLSSLLIPGLPFFDLPSASKVEPPPPEKIVKKRGRPATTEKALAKQEAAKKQKLDETLANSLATAMFNAQLQLELLPLMSGMGLPPLNMNNMPPFGFGTIPNPTTMGLAVPPPTSSTVVSASLSPTTRPMPQSSNQPSLLTGRPNNQQTASLQEAPQPTPLPALESMPATPPKDTSNEATAAPAPTSAADMTDTAEPMQLDEVIDLTKPDRSKQPEKTTAGSLQTNSRPSGPGTGSSDTTVSGRVSLEADYADASTTDASKMESSQLDTSETNGLLPSSSGESPTLEDAMEPKIDHHPLIELDSSLMVGAGSPAPDNQYEPESESILEVAAAAAATAAMEVAEAGEEAPGGQDAGEHSRADAETPPGASVNSQELESAEALATVALESTAVLPADTPSDTREGKHLPQRKNFCQECNKQCADSTAFRKHMKIHQPKAFPCDIPNCGAAFIDASKLKRHLLVHSGYRPFICDHVGCYKKFSLEFNLRAHQRVHTGERPYPCDVPGCYRRFAQVSNLVAHRKHTHQPGSEGTLKGLTSRPIPRGTGASAATSAPSVLEGSEDDSIEDVEFLGSAGPLGATVNMKHEEIKDPLNQHLESVRMLQVRAAHQEQQRQYQVQHERLVQQAVVQHRLDARAAQSLHDIDALPRKAMRAMVASELKAPLALPLALGVGPRPDHSHPFAIGVPVVGIPSPLLGPQLGLFVGGANGAVGVGVPHDFILGGVVQQAGVAQGDQHGMHVGVGGAGGVDDHDVHHRQSQEDHVQHVQHVHQHQDQDHHTHDHSDQHAHDSHRHESDVHRDSGHDEPMHPHPGVLTDSPMLVPSPTLNGVGSIFHHGHPHTHGHSHHTNSPHGTNHTLMQLAPLPAAALHSVDRDHSHRHDVHHSHVPSQFGMPQVPPAPNEYSILESIGGHGGFSQHHQHDGQHQHVHNVHHDDGVQQDLSDSHLHHHHHHLSHQDHDHHSMHHHHGGSHEHEHHHDDMHHDQSHHQDHIMHHQHDPSHDIQSMELDEHTNVRTQQMLPIDPHPPLPQ